MRFYKEINTVVHRMPDIRDLVNPDVFGNIDCLVNVEVKNFPRTILLALERLHIEYLRAPMSEKPGSSWDKAYEEIIPILVKLNRCGKKIGISSIYGTNRSITLAEALYFRLTGFQWFEPFKDMPNRLYYNSYLGHISKEVAYQQRLYMWPDYGDALFWDETGACCGGCDLVTLTTFGRDKDIELLGIPGLKAWYAEWNKQSLYHTDHWTDTEWNEWWLEGKTYAYQVKKLLPSNYRLFYMWNSQSLWSIRPEDTDDGGVFNMSGGEIEIIL